jgi:trimeric autotransporter adhesin
MRSRWSAWTIVVCLVLGVTLNSAAAFAQSFTGGLRGAVKDTNGVIPGAEVTLTNEGTQAARSAQTNESGEYVFNAVEPGSYALKVALQGYKTIAQTGIRVSTQQFLTIDLTLEVGTIQETISVAGQVPLLESSNASQGGSLDRQTMETLPSSGRNAYLMGAVMPTMVLSGDGQFVRQQDQTNASLVSLGGGTRRGNNYLLDGVPITDMRNRPQSMATMEALEDVKVQVHTYDAEMGRTGGGVFNVTAKSGGNNLHGSAFFQNRPSWGLANNYFSARAGIPLPDQYYYLGGGSVGGPIVRNKTFFWFATESYKTDTSRNVSVRMPTDLERAGDFSQTFDSKGNLVVVYDPLTTRTDPATGKLVRDAFPGNKIPASRFNQVALNMLKYLPAAQKQVSNGATNYTQTAQIIDRAQMYTGKVEHKFTDKVALSGFYLYNLTNEPCADYFEPGLNGANRFADPGDYILKRRPQMLAINNTWAGNNSVVTLRFGYTKFPDNSTLSTNFDPATLGFNSAFTNALPVKKFPGVTLTDYDQSGRTLGAIAPSDVNWYSSGLNGSYTRLLGSHTLKLGADYRKIGVEFLIYGQGSGQFNFDRGMTSCDPTVNGVTTASSSCPVSGNAMASFLLGYPTGDSGVGLSNVALSTPFNGSVNYAAGYVQDDWRVNSKLTLNYGLRIEHETGLREQQNRVTVGFDPTLSNALTSAVTIPADPVAGTPARQVVGGFMYAGVNGNPTVQGNLPAISAAPRVGAVYSVNEKTIVRGGYGLFTAPWNYASPGTANYGQIGYTNVTQMTGQDQYRPTITLDNPFPGGLVQPSGNTLGPLAGVGTSVEYVSQTKQSSRVQQFSADLQRELMRDVSVTLSYVGSRGDNLGLGGTVDAGVNINQLDPAYLSLGSALTQQVANPFYGVAAAGPLSTQATVQRRQLLRPFPQYQNVTARQITEGKSRYNAAVVEVVKRMSNGWGGRFSYTYSVLKDNQFAEGNFFSGGNSGTPYNLAYVEGSKYFNPDVEYSYGILDVPHRFAFSPMFELPFGQGKRWMHDGGLSDALVGGWTIASVVTLESGFPINITQSDNSNTFSGQQRPNVVSGTDPNTSGGLNDRVNGWINPSAFTLAAANTIGNAPRTFSNLRTPRRDNVDLSLQKNVSLSGGMRVQVRVEVINLTNTPKVRGPVQSLSASNFGQITTQSGFMRMTQIMFRLSF